MPRGKRSLSIEFEQAPEVPFVSYVLKVIKRVGWPELISNHEKPGHIQAHLVYDIASCLRKTYIGNLQAFRRFAVVAPNGRAVAQALKSIDQFRFSVDRELLAEVDAYSVLILTERHWLRNLEKSLANSLTKSRFNPDAVVFRAYWERILRIESSSNPKSPRLSHAYLSWLQSEGWKFGVESREYDQLVKRCLDEDRYVDCAYRLFGYKGFGAFMKTGPFLLPNRKAHRQCLREYVIRQLD